MLEQHQLASHSDSSNAADFPGVVVLKWSFDLGTLSLVFTTRKAATTFMAKTVAMQAEDVSTTNGPCNGATWQKGPSRTPEVCFKLLARVPRPWRSSGAQGRDQAPPRGQAPRARGWCWRHLCFGSGGFPSFIALSWAHVLMFNVVMKTRARCMAMACRAASTYVLYATVTLLLSTPLPRA
jgi:hypothetical protein